VLQLGLPSCDHQEFYVRRMDQRLNTLRWCRRYLYAMLYSPKKSSTVYDVATEIVLLSVAPMERDDADVVEMV
jgi:hypothetical protein